MLPFDITRLSNFELTDSGNPETGRYIIEAIVTHPDDTNRVASIHVASGYNHAVAELVLAALKEYKQSFHAVEELLSHVATNRVDRAIAEATNAVDTVTDEHAQLITNDGWESDSERARR